MNTFLSLKGVNQQLANPIIDRIRAFYIEDLIGLYRSSKRNNHFSIFLFCLHHLILISLQIDNDTYNNLASNVQVYRGFIRYFFFLKDFANNIDDQTHLTLNIAVIVFLAINVFIILYLFIFATFRSRIKEYPLPFASQLMQNYEYVIAIPSLYLSLENYRFYLSLLNIALTIFIGSLLISLDYGYSFLNEDILVRMDSYLNPTSFHMDIVLCITSSFFDIYVMIAITIILNVIKLFILLKNHSYLNRNVCRWSVILHLYKLNLVWILIVFFSRNQPYNLMFLLGIVLFPISYKLGDLIFTNWYEYINIESLEKSSSVANSSLFNSILDENIKKVDIFCRLLIDNISQKYKSPSSIENSTFIFTQSVHYSQHDEESKDKETKQEIVKSQLKSLAKKKIHDKKKDPTQDEKQFNVNDAFNGEIMKNIIKIYREALASKKLRNSLTNLHFSFLTLLATLNINSCQSYLEMLNLKANEKLRLGWKEDQKLEEISKLSETQSFINLLRMKKENEFKLYQILSFEDDMNKIQQQYYECMRQYKIAIEKLSLSFIDLNEAYELLVNYRKQRSELEGRIINQLSINSHSETLRNLCVNFDFFMLHKSTLLRFYEKLNRISIQQLKTKDYYSKLSCFIYVSLLDKNFGIVQKMNRGTIKSFGFANRSQLVGKSVLSILPNNFFKYSSDSLLSQILLEEFLSSYNESFFIPLFIAKNALGFSIPLQLRVQSQVVDFSDFGVTIWAKPIRDDNLYIQLDFKDNNTIKVASKIFYEEFMYDNFTMNQLKNIRVDCLIPIIGDLIKISQKDTGRKFETILIRPQDKFEAQTKPNLKDPNFLNQLKDFELFFIRVSFQSVNTRIASFVNMVIDYYEPIFYYKDKIQYIMSYQAQIKELCGISVVFDPNYQQEVLSDMRAKSYKNQEDSTQKQVKIANINKNNTFLLNESIVSHHTFNEQPHLKKINSQIGESQQNSSNNKQINFAENVSQIQNVPLNSEEKHRGSNIYISKIAIQDKIVEEGQQQYINSHANISLIQLDTLQNVQKLDGNNGVGAVDESQLYNQIMNNPTVEDNPFNEIDISKEKHNHLSKFGNHDVDNLNSKDLIDFTSKEVHQNYQEIYNTKDIQDINSKDVSVNHLLSTKQNGFQSSFLSKKMTNVNNSTRSQAAPKQKECNTNQESRMPLTQDESKRKTKLDLQSVSSSNKSVLNLYLIEMIHQKKQMTYIRVINLMGIISILVTLSLTFSGFFTFITSLISQRENFKYINWMYMMNIHISYSYSEYQVGLQNTYGWFKTPAAQFTYFTNLVLTENGSRINLTKDFMIQLYNNTNPDIQVFNIIKTKYIQQNLYYSTSHYDTNSLSLMYSMLLQMGGIFYFVKHNDPTGLIRYAGEVNYPALNSQVQSVIQELNDTYQNQLNSIQRQSLVQLFVVLGVTFIFLGCIIPSFIYTKLKQQKILELLSTFDPLALKEILGQLTYQLGNYTGFDKNQTIASRSNFSGLNQTHISKGAQTVVNIEKKLNISRTSPLTYTVKYLAVALILIFGLIMIYPVVNYVVVTMFINNSTVIYDFNNIVCESYFAIVNGLRARQGAAVSFLMPQYASLPITDYQTLFDSMMTEFNQLTGKITDNINRVKTTNLYNQGMFNDYLLKVYTGNSCDTMNNFTQYQNGNFNYSQCNSVGKNSMQAGLLNAYTFFITYFRDSYNFAYSYNTAAFLPQYNLFNANTPGYKQFQFKIEISKAHEYLLNFFQDQNYQLYDYYEYISIILFAFQMTFVLVIFIFSWSHYFNQINNVIYQTKELLDIFPQQTLLQNTYIMSFLRQNE